MLSSNGLRQLEEDLHLREGIFHAKSGRLKADLFIYKGITSI